MNSLISIIQERFEYDNGRLLYKARLITNPSLHHKEAGCLYSNGYRMVVINKKRYQVSHIIWVLINGNFPKEELDHINHNPCDNRIENLRESSRTENQRSRRIQINNTSGYKGVKWSKADRKWRATIHINGKKTHLGMFTNLVEAALSYNEAAKEHFGEFAVLNKVKRAGI